jgi:putative heme-binding domain-containing protein
MCHNPWVEKKTTIFGIQSASPLGVNNHQLNNPQEGGGKNQLATLHRLGLLAWKPEPEKLSRLVDPYDDSADLDLRARSYLQTNCSHCHQFNAGGAANIALGYDVPLADAKMVDVRPIQGTFNISGARIIAPGDPAGSVLYYRVSKLGGGRMPRVGSNQVDERASRMIHDWIARMPRLKDTDPGGGLARTAADDRAALESLQSADQLTAPARTAAIRRLTASTRGALMLLGLIGARQTSESLHREVIAITRDCPQVEIRDLFERFIPPSERLKRLGDVVDASAILALRGDALRGRAVFATNPAAQCKTCHKAGDLGENIGPELTKIGAKYGKPALLEQILDPSKTIEPQFIAYLMETKDGRVLTGLVGEKNGQVVVLKDNQGKTIRVPAGEIERLVPQSRSLMPDLLLRDLTAQQVADLLEFLATMK